MISDEERREVARRLREMDYADLQESLICAYLDALGIEGYTDWVGIAHRLADLIEPPARCPHYMHPCCRTDAAGDYIDRDAMLELVDELERPMRDGGYSKRIARRIREALGV